MDKAHDVQNVSISGTILRLQVDGRDYEVDVSHQSERLASAAQEQREHFEISPSGYGIHWLGIDEDLSIDGLIGVSHQPPRIKAQT